MSKVYFTSDLHLGHTSLIKNLRNMSVDEHDDLIIDNWNKVVSKHDKVYVLGDFVMEKHNLIPKYLKSLKGDIVLVCGNHDTPRCCVEFNRLNIPTLGVLKYKGFLCTHTPVNFVFGENRRGNIHGHIHSNKGIMFGTDRYNEELPAHTYYNVNVEFNDYKPVLFEDIVKHFKYYQAMQYE